MVKALLWFESSLFIEAFQKADLFNPDAILECLSKAPQSNSDNILVKCYNSSSDVTDYLLQDPVMTNSNWNVAAYGSNQRLSKYYYDLLTNMRGAGTVDPRMTKIVPAAMCNIKLNADGKVQSYDWLRSVGVDFYGESARLTAGGELYSISCLR